MDVNVELCETQTMMIVMVLTMKVAVMTMRWVRKTTIMTISKKDWVMLVRVTTEVPEVVTSKQWFIKIICTQEIPIQDEKLWNSTGRWNSYIRLYVNECIMLFFVFLPTFPMFYQKLSPSCIPYTTLPKLWASKNGMVPIFFCWNSQNLILGVIRNDWKIW